MPNIDGDRLPTLSSARVKLCWLEERDAPALFDIFSNEKVMRYWSSLPWTDESQAVAYIRRIHESFAAGALYQWGVARSVCGETGDSNVASREADAQDDAGSPGRARIIGTCTLAGIDLRNRRAEIGFILRHDCWGRGLMREAAGALLDFAFGEMNLHRIEADTDPRNTPSITLLEKLGFQREGLLRERWLVGDEVTDTVFYGLLAREWGAS